jgi:S1-C subfamily serine protease
MHRSPAVSGLLPACIGVFLALAYTSLSAELPADTIARVESSVVVVGTFQRARNPAFNFLGMGFAVGDGGLIATSTHVLAQSLNLEQQALAIAIPKPGGPLHVQEARSIAADPAHDLALLRMERARLTPLALRDFASVKARAIYSLASDRRGPWTGYASRDDRGHHADRYAAG